MDSVSLSLNDVKVTFGDLRDNAAWKGFLKSLKSVEKLADEEAIEVREKIKSRWKYRAAVAAVAILIICAVGVAIKNLYFRPAPPPAL